jgi:hypothetical protein
MYDDFIFPFPVSCVLCHVSCFLIVCVQFVRICRFQVHFNFISSFTASIHRHSVARRSFLFLCLRGEWTDGQVTSFALCAQFGAVRAPGLTAWFLSAGVQRTERRTGAIPKMFFNSLRVYPTTAAFRARGIADIGWGPP